MLNIACFVSGSGSDMQTVIDAVESGYIKNGKVELVISSNPNAYALERAKKHNIKSAVFEKKNFIDISEMFDEIIKLTEAHSIDFIILAGYLTILSKNFVKKYKDRIINIHPSLIPKYCGKGFYGMNVHRAVIENKEKESGVTVHFVDEGVDTGNIIMQEKVAVLEGDTPEVLQKRVLETEHKILPKAIKKILDEYTAKEEIK